VMPDQGGRLSDKEKTEILLWLEKHWPDPKVCPICGHDEWTLGDHLVTLFVWSSGALLAGSVAYPQAVVTCDTCCYTRLFNALLMGIIKEQEGKNG